MNKKIFTLLASSLMLFLAAMVVNAQNPQPLFGAPVDFLPSGMGKGAYHLQVTGVGDYTFEHPEFTDVDFEQFLSMDSKGWVTLVTYDMIENSPKPYEALRSAMWCVEIFEPAKAGQVPTFHFKNKQQSAYLQVDAGRWEGEYFGDSWDGDAILSQLTRAAASTWTTTVKADGFYRNWAFSTTYLTTPLERGIPLKLEIADERDYFMTFAMWPVNEPNALSGNIQLVKVHGKDLEPGSYFYENHLVFFTLRNAAPRIINAEAFNTMFGQREKEDFVTLQFDPGTVKSVNPFAQPLKAVQSTTGGAMDPLDAEYVNLYTSDNATTRQYLYVADSTLAANYHNTSGKLFPIIKQQKAIRPNGQSDFRFVYYPSEDSLVINVRYIDHVIDGITFDNGDRLPYHSTAPAVSIGEGFYNMKILNHLIIRLQDLVTADGTKVITAYDWPPTTRIHFGNNTCAITGDRTTVPPNLYVIRDKLGRYLVMPLESGDFKPQWMYLEEWEKPLKTPSSQWLVKPEYLNSPTSTVEMINREFSWVSIDFSQIYSVESPFEGIVNYHDLTGSLQNDRVPAATVLYKSTPDAKGWFGSFKIVEDDADVKALIEAGLEDQLTEDQWQRRYRTSPYLGYKFISTDTLNYHGYAFNYWHNYSKNFFLYTPELGSLNKNGTQDSTLYVAQNKNYFQLHLADSLLKYGAEPYGIGYGDGLLDLPETEDIAELVRYYYYVQQNDYWNFSFDSTYITLDRNGRYVFGNEKTINSNEFQKAKFYLRFTYQPENDGKQKDPIAVNNSFPEYYTLLHRINQSNFPYVRNVLGLEIHQTLKQVDYSHMSGGGAWGADGYGVLTASVDDKNLFVRAQTKSLGAQRVSTFALAAMTEPLYRRFNNVLADTDCGDTGSDDPRTLKFYRTLNPGEDYLFEDMHTDNSFKLTSMNSPKGSYIHFAGVESKSIHAAEVARDVNHWDLPWHNYGIYVDTAYVNRGTGHIKPQYMLAVGVKFFNGNCTTCGIPIEPAVYGRYLINATDSAKKTLENPANYNLVRDKAFIWDRVWDRLAFVPAVHVGDTLYILNVPADKAEKFLEQFFVKVDNDEIALQYIKLGNHPLVNKKRLDNNEHKDFVFSMRFYQKVNGVVDTQNFLLESETTNRSTAVGRMIAPMHGGWVRMQNHELVINRGSYHDAILDAEKWNTECADMTPEEAVNNEAVAAVKVIAGQGAVTILNAAGKQIVISNVLGQTVAKAVLTSDNATIAAPKGVLVVAVEGESAVKAVVK